ncbi:MAG: DUF3473 domain-containing protein [Alphaproteobacteria bacterium]|nr:DUF3473 domain-containing protein [Alphaproteobacteria bacterium]
MVNAMSVDVEEYFQVSAFSAGIDSRDWDTLSSRIEQNMETLFTLFDDHNVKCTFFTLGWVADRHKKLTRQIVDAGHELASHGYEHQRATTQTSEEFRSDVRRTKDILENAAGVQVSGFRAASFSFDTSNPWTHEVLAEEGYDYSSSVYPVRHDHYGVPNAPRFTYEPAGRKGAIEIPLSTVRFSRWNFPCAGGGYFRLLPYAVSRWAIRNIHQSDARPAIFYFHPWEIDADQPRVYKPGLKTRFRHYVNIETMKDKLDRVLTDFAWGRVDEVFCTKKDDPL